MTLPPDDVYCGRWRLKPFELVRPVLLLDSGPITLGDFLKHPDPDVVEKFRALDEEQRQALVVARLAGAPPDLPISLFGLPATRFATPCASSRKALHLEFA